MLHLLEERLLHHILERGHAALLEGQLAVAAQELEAALRVDPDNIAVLNDLGTVAIMSDDLGAAERHLSTALAKDPTADRVANNLGLVLARLGRYAEAAAAYRKALAIDSGFTAARFNLAISLHRLDQNRRALRELDRVAREDPDMPGLERAIQVVRAAARGM